MKLDYRYTLRRHIRNEMPLRPTQPVAFDKAKEDEARRLYREEAAKRARPVS